MNSTGSCTGDSARRPYVDRPIGDQEAATAAARAATERWGLPAPTPWRQGMNAIFLAGDAVIRVGQTTAPASASVHLHSVLRDAGIPVPRPLDIQPLLVGPYTVSAWERLYEVTSPTSWETVGALVARLHSLNPDDLPAEYPLADPRGFAWWNFQQMLSELDSHLDSDARAGLEAAVSRGEGWTRFTQDDTVVCHGDVHPGNVVNTASGPVLLDWDLLCAAPRGWDHGPLMTWHERWGGDAIYQPFAAGYGWSGNDDPFAEAVAELRLVAATLMRVRAGLTDRAARQEAEIRLRYWRGEPHAPPWNAQ